MPAMEKTVGTHAGYTVRIRLVTDLIYGEYCDRGNVG